MVRARHFWDGAAHCRSREAPGPNSLPKNVAWPRTWNSDHCGANSAIRLWNFVSTAEVHDSAKGTTQHFSG
eukprot:8178640-Pyramimonas_sp.AAC.1